ncbi:RdgB/HAM1 family non-canonical purine NTP pyrophosphatase [Acidithiobacillus sp.]
MTELVLATGNPGKLRELTPPLAALGFTLHTQAELGIAAVAETAGTFVENALLKARHAAQCSGLAALAEDSGLCVPALGGAPGLFSARYAGENATDAENNAKLLRAMESLRGSARQAYFTCCMVYLAGAEDPSPLIGQGFWFGEIASAPGGSGGFGYDPVFCPTGLGGSAAELDSTQKGALSHRGAALRALLALLSQQRRYSPQPASPRD